MAPIRGSMPACWIEFHLPTPENWMGTLPDYLRKAKASTICSTSIARTPKEFLKPSFPQPSVSTVRRRSGLWWTRVECMGRCWWSDARPWAASSTWCNQRLLDQRNCPARSPSQKRVSMTYPGESKPWKHPSMRSEWLRQSKCLKNWTRIKTGKLPFRKSRRSNLKIKSGYRPISTATWFWPGKKNWSGSTTFKRRKRWNRKLKP